MFHSINFLGSSLPEDITTLNILATSHELAIFVWLVPTISYTPEVYTIQYRSLGADVVGPLMMSEPIQGTTDLSATNQDFRVVVDDLLPGTTYSYSLVATNLNGSVITPPLTFTTRDPSEYMCGDIIIQ